MSQINTDFSPHDAQVSIIVPTWNSESTLPFLLESIAAQDFHSFEVIVVDNFSTDRTPAIAKRYGAKLIQLRSNRVVARSEGIRHAKGKYVFLVDSDQTLDSKCISILAATSSERPRDALVARELSYGRTRWACLLAREDDVEFDLGIGLPRWFPITAVAGFPLIKLRDAAHVHGEDRMLTAWVKENGHSISYVRDAVMWHEDLPILPYFRKQYQNAASGTAGTLLRRYFTVTHVAALSKINLISVRHSMGSGVHMPAYAYLIGTKIFLQALGIVSARFR